MSAAYINLTQAVYNKKGDLEFVQVDFQNMLTAHLMDHSIDECNKALEEMTKLEQGSDFQEEGS